MSNFPFSCEQYWNTYKPPRQGTKRGNDINDIAVIVRSDAGVALGIPVTIIGPNSPTIYNGLPPGSKVANFENGGCQALQRPEAKILLECGFFTPMAHDITTELTSCLTSCHYLWTPVQGLLCLLSSQAIGLLRIVGSQGINWGIIKQSEDKLP